MEGLAYFVLFAVLIVVLGLVAISALIINAVVKVKLAKYSSIQQSSQPITKQDGVWPPPPLPLTADLAEPTPPQAATLPQREGEE